MIDKQQSELIGSSTKDTASDAYEHGVGIQLEDRDRRLDRHSIATRSPPIFHSELVRVSRLSFFVASRASTEASIREPRVSAGDTMLAASAARVRSNVPSNRSTIRVTRHAAPRYPFQDICSSFASGSARLLIFSAFVTMPKTQGIGERRVFESGLRAAATL